MSKSIEAMLQTIRDAGTKRKPNTLKSGLGEAVVAHVFNHEAEPDDLCEFEVRLVYGEFQDSQGYTQTLSQNKTKLNSNKTK